MQNETSKPNSSVNILLHIFLTVHIYLTVHIRSPVLNSYIKYIKHRFLTIGIHIKIQTCICYVLSVTMDGSDEDTPEYEVGKVQLHHQYPLTFSYICVHRISIGGTRRVPATAEETYMGKYFLSYKRAIF